MLTAIGAAANGFGRFAYGLLLPAMRHGLGWSTFAAGTVSAANVAGYLVGALLAAPVISLAGESTAALVALTTATSALAACAATTSLPLLLALRAANGGAAAVAFIAGGVLIARRTVGASPAAATRISGVYFAGPGIGILISGPLIGPLARAGHWQDCWLLLAAASVACILVSAPALLHRSRRQRVQSAPPAPGTPARATAIWPVVASYGAFGAGYIAFMTFVVAYMQDRQHASEARVMVFWMVLGAAGLLIGVALVPAAGRLLGRRLLAGLLALSAVGAVIPLFWSSPSADLVAAALFASFFSVSAAAARFVQHALPPERWAAGLSLLTIVFGAGQCAGPLLSGALSSTPGGLRTGLLGGVALLLLALLLALFADDTPVTRR